MSRRNFSIALMKRHLVLGVLGLATFFILGAAGAADDFSGKWMVEEGRVIEISKKNGEYNGYGVPENVHVLRNVKYSEGKWKGIVYNPRNKKEAPCEVELDGKDKLNVTAVVGKFRKLFVWKRVK